ncbi:hypothetical protein DFQ26_004151 [Actinomortierella ambigua]|nr:hypothetical protein DFQ26_004151 [Actinomortierella ambigua]
MDHSSQDISSPADGGDSDSSSPSPPVPDLESVSDGQPDGSDWETDEGEGTQDEPMPSTDSPFMGDLGSYPYFHMGGYGVDDDHFDDEMDYDAEDDFWSEDFDMEDDFDLDLDDDGLWNEDAVIDGDLEELTPFVRAVLHDGEEDVMSEFSGDEKYEPKVTLTGNVGEGETDIYDPLENDGGFDLHDDDAKLTMKMRQLLINLDKGRRERERLLGIQQRPQEQPDDLTAAPSPSSPQHNPFSLHRLIVRGPDQPQELSYSPSTSIHPQCGNSIAVAPSDLGIRDDVYTIHDDSVIRCGILDAMTEELHRQRRIGHIHDHEDLPLPELVNPSVTPLKVSKATKFLDRSLYNYRHLPEKEKLVIFEGESALCMAVRYGYLVLGTDDGTLMTFCLQDKGEPLNVYEGPIDPGDDPDDDPAMINSVDIVRWPRYQHSTSAEPEQVMEEHESGEAAGIDKRDDPTARLTQKDMYDHCVVITGNDRGLFIASLPDHVDPNAYNGIIALEEDGYHAFKSKQDHTWIRRGFDGEWLNDARVSPDGNWIAVIGDAQKVWVIKIEHTQETEEQRRQRLKEDRMRLLDDLETDESEYESEEDNNIARQRRTGVVEVLTEDVEQPIDEAEGSSTGSHKVRLLHLFGKPEALPIPDHVVRMPRARRPGARAENSSFGHQSPGAYTAQYVAWNASSTKFAHTSDSHQRVLIWSMPSKQLVCSVDAGGLSFGISFHPKLDNMFAFANRYGFVHVVDVTNCCVGDEGFILPKEKYRFKTVSTNSNEGNGNGQTADSGVTESVIQECGAPHYQEKHDILMASFRGQENRWLRILDYLNGLSWSSDGRHLYVATKRRVLRYTVADPNVRIPSLFDICANRTKDWLEQRMLTRHNKRHGRHVQEAIDRVDKAHEPIPRQWEVVPSWIKQRILGDHIQLRYHDG